MTRINLLNRYLTFGGIVAVWLLFAGAALPNILWIIPALLIIFTLNLYRRCFSPALSFLLGIFLDLLNGTPFGVHASALLMATALINLVAGNLISKTLSQQLTFIAGLLIGYQLVIRLSEYIGGYQHLTILMILLNTLIGTILWGVVFGPIIVKYQQQRHCL